MELSNRKALIERARVLMIDLSLTPLECLEIAEREFEEQKKKENE